MTPAQQRRRTRNIADHYEFMDEVVRLTRHLVEIYRMVIDHPPVRVTHDGDRLVFIETVGFTELVDFMDPHYAAFDPDPFRVISMIMANFDYRLARKPAKLRIRAAGIL